MTRFKAIEDSYVRWRSFQRYIAVCQRIHPLDRFELLFQYITDVFTQQALDFPGQLYAQLDPAGRGKIAAQPEAQHRGQASNPLDKL